MLKISFQTISCVDLYFITVLLLCHICLITELKSRSTRFHCQVNDSKIWAYNCIKREKFVFHMTHIRRKQLAAVKTHQLLKITPWHLLPLPNTFTSHGATRFSFCFGAWMWTSFHLEEGSGTRQAVEEEKEYCRIWHPKYPIWSTMQNTFQCWGSLGIQLTTGMIEGTLQDCSWMSKNLCLLLSPPLHYL